MKSLLLILLTIGMFGLTEKPASGIFIVKNPSRKNPCEQELKMLIGGKKVCVLEKPIISIDEVVYVTDILYDPVLKRNHIKLGLSSSCINKLNQTVGIMVRTEFAIVVNNDVIGIFSIPERINEHFLRLGTDLDFKDLATVRDALKKVQE